MLGCEMEEGGVPVSDAPNGIYILTTDNLLYTSDQWNASMNNLSVGVALISNKSRFVIHPDDDGMNFWSVAGIYDEAPGVTTTTEQSEAEKDYKGVDNTNALVDHYGKGTVHAAGWCDTYVFKNGKHGYLGSCGEWFEMYKNKSEMDLCISLISGSPIKTDEAYWTSTQYDIRSAYTIGWLDGFVRIYRKDRAMYVRAFAEID